MPVHPWLAPGARAARRGKCIPGTGRGLKLPGQADSVGGGDCQVKENRKDSKIYANWMTPWCEGDKTRNANLGSTRKRDARAAL